MIDIRQIDGTMAVSPQIQPEDLAPIAAHGFRAIVNNRPDGEEHGQPAGEAIRAAAEAAGLAYTAIPVSGGFSMPQIEAMARALGAAGGPVLAFCRSGTRSSNLWALASAKAGGDPDTLIGKAAGAGYDLSGLRPALEQLQRDA